MMKSYLILLRTIRSKIPNIFNYGRWFPTIERSIEAGRLGFDCVSTTLMGLQQQNRKDITIGWNNDFARFKEILKTAKIPVYC